MNISLNMGSYNKILKINFVNTLLLLLVVVISRCSTLEYVNTDGAKVKINDADIFGKWTKTDNPDLNQYFLSLKNSTNIWVEIHDGLYKYTLTFVKFVGKNNDILLIKPDGAYIKLMRTKLLIFPNNLNIWQWESPGKWDFQPQRSNNNG